MGGKESWTDDKVETIFTNWARSTDFAARRQRPHVAGRGHRARQEEVGHVPARARSSRATSTGHRSQQDIIDDIDFFAFPEIDADIGQDAVEAPIDGFMMAASPGEPRGRQGAAGRLGSVGRDRRLHRRQPVGGRRQLDGRTPAATTRCSRSRPRLVGAAKYIAQFLDRDTEPDFASQVVGKGLADFIAGPARSTRILVDHRGAEADVHVRVIERMSRDDGDRDRIDRAAPANEPRGSETGRTTRRRSSRGAAAHFQTFTRRDRLWLGVMVGDPGVAPHRAGVDPGPADRHVVVRGVGQPAPDLGGVARRLPQLLADLHDLRQQAVPGAVQQLHAGRVAVHLLGGRHPVRLPARQEHPRHAGSTRASTTSRSCCRWRSSASSGRA